MRLQAVTTIHSFSRSWKFGKGFAFSTFPLLLILFFEHEFPEKVTMKKRENGNKYENPLSRYIIKAFSSNFLTLT
jgi:hypothetical protein